ncbi:hypothetical protein EVG20_g823 [Dentipellis fragilis]|uniref:Uncharacterized protein n=1 Tax=Dentipellis fragilis TaxID=205917 RepID=A0A4Y9ZBF6_9AGAM|nr:hypothetical protein EVG20_g823 [Dentipellis fragilis]
MARFRNSGTGPEAAVPLNGPQLNQLSCCRHISFHELLPWGSLCTRYCGEDYHVTSSMVSSLDFDLTMYEHQPGPTNHVLLNRLNGDIVQVRVSYLSMSITSQVSNSHENEDHLVVTLNATAWVSEMDRIGADIDHISGLDEAQVILASGRDQLNELTWKADKNLVHNHLCARCPHLLTDACF